MRKLLFHIFFITTLFSCKPNDYGAIHAKPFNQVIFSAESSSFYKIEKFHENRKLLVNQEQMLQEGYTFERLDSCDSGPPPLIDMEKMKKYPHGMPFDIIKQDKNGQIVVQFKFIKDCCLEHIGKIKRSSPKLYLYYSNVSETACDCYCEYKYRFSIDPRGETYTNVSVLPD